MTIWNRKEWIVENATYTEKTSNHEHFIHYNPEEHNTWKFLFNRQMKIIQQYACESYLKGVEILNFPSDRIPQCWEVSDTLMRTTGWSIEPVTGFVPEKEFFKLLQQRKFPAATFIRCWNEINYLKEPDIFHEFFGHCPMLTNSDCAGFMQYLGEVSRTATLEEHHYLGRLYWFTFEAGLIQSPTGLKIYGGAILSSKSETIHCAEDKQVIFKPFNLEKILLTPYRVDILQSVYFVLKDFSELYQLTKVDLLDKIHEAQDSACPTK